MYLLISFFFPTILTNGPATRKATILNAPTIIELMYTELLSKF